MTTMQALGSAEITSSTTRNAQSTIASDFNAFLQMLTTQIRNQDPLNPMESTEFATQLATFAGVEQQVRTNDHLSQIGSRLSQTGLSQVAGWLGMDAAIAGLQPFAGQPLELQLPEVGAVAEAALVVTTSTGLEIDRQVLQPPLSTTLQWTGRRADGQTHPSGNYEFRLETGSQATGITSHPVSRYARIEETAIGQDGTVSLRLADGRQATIDGITAPRNR